MARRVADGCWPFTSSRTSTAAPTPDRPALSGTSMGTSPDESPSGRVNVTVQVRPPSEVSDAGASSHTTFTSSMPSRATKADVSPPGPLAGASQAMGGVEYLVGSLADDGAPSVSVNEPPRCDPVTSLVTDRSAPDPVREDDVSRVGTAPRGPTNVIVQERAPVMMSSSDAVTATHAAASTPSTSRAASIASRIVGAFASAEMRDVEASSAVLPSRLR